MSPEGGFGAKIKADDMSRDEGFSMGAEVAPEPKAKQEEEATVLPIRENALEELDEHLPAKEKDEKPKAEPKSRPAKDPGSDLRLRLPNDLLYRARGAVRRHRTGGERALGAGIVIQAYVEAVDEILKKAEIDTYGIERGDQKEMTKRVKQALTEALAAEK